MIASVANVEVRIGQHDRVILGAAQRLHALAVARARLVDVLRDRRRADERDRLHVGCASSASTASLSPCTTLNTPSGSPASFSSSRHADRQRRIALRRLQHERVAARDRDREHPQRHHRGKVERRDARAHAERLAQREAVHVGADVLAELALQQMRNARGELDHLDAARDLAFGVGERLAVLLRDDLREVLAVRVHQLAEAHQDARAAQRRRARARPGSAAAAAATAASTSAALASGTWRITSPVAGLVTSP